MPDLLKKGKNYQLPFFYTENEIKKMNKKKKLEEQKKIREEI